MRSHGALIGLVVAACGAPATPTAAEQTRQALDATAIPPQWASAADQASVIDNWLFRFKDAQLVAMVREAARLNPDVRLATARVAAATAQMKAAGARLYPSVSAVGRAGAGLGGD